MSDTCFQCHGPDKEAREGNLRLDRRTDAIKARDDGAAIAQRGEL